MTTANPEELRVLVPQGLTGTEDRPLTIPYEIVRRGGWPDRGATVELALPEGWRAVSATKTRFARIGRRRKGTFRVIPQTSGTKIVNISVARIYNQPHAAFRVTVLPPEGWLTSGAVPLFLSASLIVGAAALTRAGWRQRARDKQSA